MILRDIDGKKLIFATVLDRRNIMSYFQIVSELCHQVHGTDRLPSLWFDSINIPQLIISRSIINDCHQVAGSMRNN